MSFFKLIIAFASARVILASKLLIKVILNLLQQCSPWSRQARTSTDASIGHSTVLSAYHTVVRIVNDAFSSFLCCRVAQWSPLFEALLQMCSLWALSHHTVG